MGLKTVRRLVASIANAGESRVKIIDAARAKEALTRDDARSLIKEGAVVIEQKKGVGRNKARFKQSRVHSGRRRGPGSRKGASFAGKSRKERWVEKVRSQRKVLKSMKSGLAQGAYRKLYSMIKGNLFKTKKQLLSYARENKLLK
ncbi:MAG: 50S ribosomal protein L19e [Candidatus Norongarragalinales archaeon]